MVNAGSWLCVIEVDNKELENLINEGIIKGLSLFSYANGKSRYMDVENKDDVYPLFISFVKYPANQVIFEVLDKDSYISKMEDVNLADKEKNLIEKIKNLISSAEAEEEAPQEEIVDKAEEEIKDEQVIEEQKVEKPIEEEIVDKEEEKPQEEVKEDVAQEEAQVEEKPQEEEIVEKECGANQEVVEKDEDIVTGVTNDDILNAIVDLKEAILQALVPEEPVEEEIVEEITEPSDEPETYIIKQATQKTDVIEEQKVEKKQYFDILGRKL